MRNYENLKLLQNPLYDFYSPLGYETIIDYSLDKISSKTGVSPKNWTDNY